jgi:SAM-dependent methyltransferase/5'(3')-deoxyribonucleotidase
MTLKSTNNQIAKDIHQEFYSLVAKGKIEWTDQWAKPFYPFIFESNNFKSVIDIGCGDGSFINKCADNSFEKCTATDLITVDLNLVKKNKSVRYLNTPASELDLNETFDLVTSFECLEHVHLDEVDATLDKMFSLADKYLCLSIAHKESGEKTEDGRNLHLTVKDWKWWSEKLSERGEIFQVLSPSDKHRTFVIVNKKPTLYCDIDSTVNNHYVRIKRHTSNGTCNFTAAHSREELMKDEVLPHAKNSIDTLSKKYNIVFLTARNFPNAYNLTREWLVANNLYFDSIIVVNRSIDKIKHLRGANCLFIDDLSRKHETNPPYKVLYHDTIKALEDRKINYILFKGDWKEVMSRLGYE